MVAVETSVNIILPFTGRRAGLQCLPQPPKDRSQLISLYCLVYVE